MALRFFTCLVTRVRNHNSTLKHRTHFSTTTLADNNPLQLLSPAEQAKAIMMTRISGTLSTVALEDKSGNPIFGSLMPYVLQQKWYSHPLVAVRKDEKHYSHIKRTAKGSLLIFPLTPKHIVPPQVPIPRVNITGDFKEITEEADVATLIDKYAEVHVGSKPFLSEKFTDTTNLWVFYEFVITQVHILSSTGQLFAVTGEDFRQAKEDPIAPFSRKFIDEINTKQSLHLNILCEEFGEVKTRESFVYSMDRLGVDVLGKDFKGENWHAFRMPWQYPLRTMKEVESVFRQTLQEFTKGSK